MKNIKNFKEFNFLNEAYSKSSDENKDIIKVLDELRIYNFKIENDVFKFDKHKISFEIYAIDHDEYKVSYRKHIKWIKVITKDLKTTLIEILNYTK